MHNNRMFKTRIFTVATGSHALVGLRSAICLIAWLYCAMPATALDLKKPLADFMYQTWSVDDGLPHSAIRGVTQTADGYIWFATHEGLARFDGVNFTVFDAANAPALRGNGVLGLLAASDGSLYAGLREGGIARFHQGVFSAVLTDTPLPGGQTAFLAQDRSGAIWSSFGAGGIARISGRQAALFTVAEGLPGNLITALRATADGDVWIGTANGLVVYREGKLVTKPTGSWLDSANIADVLIDGGKRLWVATASEGLAVMEGQLIRRIRQRDGLASESLTRLLEDRHGGIWVGTLEGVQRMAAGDPGRIERITAADGLSNNNIRSLFEDNESGVWVGTDQGVNRFRESPLITWGARRGLTEEFTRTVLEDRKGVVWVATADGLFSIDGSTTRRFGREQGLLTNAILSLAEDPDGTLWIGTNSGGLHRMAGGRIEQVSGRAGLSSAAVRAILPARDGSLWIGTANSLSKWSWQNNAVAQRVVTKDGRPAEQVNALHEGKQGEIWVGTRSGLGVIDSVAGTLNLDEFGLALPVLSINSDGEGQVWVNLVSHGTALVVGESGKRTVRRLTPADGLPEQSYFVALDDQRGGMWLCSTRGIVKLAKSQVAARLAGKGGKITPEFYTRADGMASTQCNGATQPAGWRMRDGRLLFPTAKGVAVANPDGRQSSDRRVLPIHIRSVDVDGARVAPADGAWVRIPPGNHRLEVAYVGLSFSEPEKIRYRYRLEGFDNAWVDAQRETKATFTNLKPGEYLFRVQTSREGRDWNERGAALRVEQQAYLYETHWFRWGGLLAVLLAGFAAYRARVHQLKMQRQLLRTTVDERTRELQLEKQKLELASNEKAKLLVQVADTARAYEKLSKEDALTGIANRRELDRFLAHEFERAARHDRPLTVVLADLDHFKQINDRYSHGGGDDVLRDIARLLSDACRNIDMVARYGGEEFVLVLPETGADVARAICERLRHSVETYDWGARHPGLKVTMSFGIAARAAEDTFERLVAVADERLYEAKKAGRNCVRG